MSIALFATASPAFGWPVDQEGGYFPLRNLRFPKYLWLPFKAVAS
jgi:hypothetical protein